jgi:hypothetical protein
MQKGQDAELSSRLRQQQLKAISEQQWRLSVIDDSTTKLGSLKPLNRLTNVGVPL